MIDYNIISTGSQGNAVIINKFILVDCGVPYKAIKPYSEALKIVLLTHIHTDHFKPTTIRKLSSERPTLRFACCKWLVKPLIEAGVPKSNIDIYDIDNLYDYGIFKIEAFPLTHNVPNCGFKIHFPDGGKMVYATDTNNLDNVSAINYDLYMIEANYEDTEIQERINRKTEQGEYAYEYNVLKNHLSKAKCNEFIHNNASEHSECVYLHGHKEKELKNG
jgi:Cft2 family RNA processing exonuclease